MAAQAEIDSARLSAATDAGFALAVAAMLDQDLRTSIPIDGQARRLRFGDATLAVAIQSEQGKVPLNAIDERQARRLFTRLGVGDDRLDLVVDSLFDWIDDDDEPRPEGAETDYYAPRHIRPRNGSLLSVEETGLIRGFDPPLVEALEAVATVHFGRGSFRPELASPLTIAVLLGEDAGAIDIIDRQRALSGQTTALSFGEQGPAVGQPLSVIVTAALENGARRRSRHLIALTGNADAPFVVIERD